MAFEITGGKIQKAQKVVVYGPEGIGKSTFASCFPHPLFIDTEGSTHNLDVSRLPRPTSWAMLGQEIAQVIVDKPCKTLVVDTVDWAEQLCLDYICQNNGKKGIEDFGYGNGYVYEKEEFARFLNKLEDVISAGINVVLTAHAQMRKFSQPDEIGEYDRWELKLGKKTGSQISPLVKEWGDLLLFATYKTMAVAVDKDGTKFKAQGNSRVMYTNHHACWDAKNRHGLPDELPFDYSGIAHIFTAAPVTVPVAAPIATPTETPIPEKKYWFNGEKVFETDGEMPKSEKAVFEIDKDKYTKLKQDIAEFERTVTMSPPAEPPKSDPTPTAPPQDEPVIDELPKALTDLMANDAVTVREIQRVVGLKGYYPADTPVSAYDPDFVNGVLVGAWTQVFGMIKQQRELNSIPQ